MRDPLRYASVPQLLESGGTVLILGSGPSLTEADVAFARTQADATIAVNDAYKFAPDADVLYAADKKWWGWHKGCTAPHKVGTVKYPAFAGRLRYSLTQTPWYPTVQVLQRGPKLGLALERSRVGLGYNGVYQAINVAVHLGASRIVLLGVDMKGGHFFGHHPDRSAPPFTMCLSAFTTLVEPLRAAGVAIVNCTPGTALKAFPQQALAETFPVPQQVAV